MVSVDVHMEGRVLQRWQQVALQLTAAQVKQYVLCLLFGSIVCMNHWVLWQ